MFGVLKIGKLGASMKKAGFNPRALFAASEPGAWYDPSDLTTLFQDAAGTIPVTAVEQPVGKMLDKSGRGNHATQATTTKRPTLKQDAAGCYYLSFDGVDDAMQTENIDFTSTDKMTVVAGVRSLVGGVYGALVELSVNANDSNGAFLMSGNGNLTTYRVVAISRGTASGSALANSTAYNPPVSYVATHSSSISTDVSILRINGVQAAASATDQGTGNYGNYPLFIGSRGGTSNPFNGHLYSLIVRGAQSTEQQIASAEAWVNTKTGAY